MWLAQMMGWFVFTCKLTTISSTSDLPEQSKPYQFGYTVRDEETGDFKTHQEVNDGKEVRGMYSLGEPNGDLRVVTYTADKVNGFRALVQVQPGGSPIRPSHSPDVVKQRSPHHPVVVRPSELSEGNENNWQHNVTHASPANLRNYSQSHIKQDVQEESYSKPKYEQEQITKTESRYETSEKTTQVTINEDRKLLTLLKEMPPLDKHVPKIEYIVEDQDGPGVKPIQFRNIDALSHGPKVIPVKIQDELSGSDSEFLVLQPSREIETYAPPEQDGAGFNQTNNSTHFYDSKEQISSSYVQIENVNEQKNKGTETNMTINKNEASLGATNNTKVVTKTNSEFLKTIPGSLTKNKQVTHDQVQKFEEPELVKVETQKAEKENDDSMSQEMNTSDNRQNNVDIKTTELRPNNNLMLAALLLSTSPVLKYKCLPETSEKDSLTPTLPSNVVPPGSSHETIPPYSPDPGRMILTTGIPFYPFQLVNISPVRSADLTSASMISSQSPPPYFSSPQFTAVPSTVYDGLRTPIQKLVPHVPVAEEMSATQKPQSGYTSLRGEGTSGHNNQKPPPSSHYLHSLLPPPWAAHPLRSGHHSHHKHMPIFVLPMSHNFNFAPTFDPSMFEKHNN